MSTGQPPDPEATFADVLNGLTLGGGGRRKRKRKVEHTAAPPPENEIPNRIDWSWTTPPTAPAEPANAPAAGSAAGPDDVYPGPSADAAIVRPYAWTGGRTKSTMDLRIETMVSTSEHGENIEAMIQTEHRSIAQLCREPRSVAEVATLLAVPLGVAKVLLGDMAGLGLVIVHKTATGGANKAHLMLMERVLSGLRRL